MRLSLSYQPRQVFLVVLSVLLLQGFVVNLRLLSSTPLESMVVLEQSPPQPQRELPVAARSQRNNKSVAAKSRRQQKSTRRSSSSQNNTLQLLKAASLPAVNGTISNDTSIFEGLPDLQPPYLYTDQQVKDYASSFDSFHRSLSFVHIPKTGGSTLENNHRDQPWGKCLFIGRTPPPGITVNGCAWQSQPHALQMMYHDVPDWHVPAHFFPFRQADPYQHTELFAVIRMPPLDRAVSQYFWFCAEVRRYQERTMIRQYCARRHHNKAQASIHRYFRDRLHPTTLREYLMDHGHWIPQYDYIVGPLQVRYVTHVLQLPNMKTEYATLGRAYGLNLTWPDTRDNAQAHNKKQPSVSREIQAKLADHFQSDWLLVQGGEVKDEKE